jgi:cytochrome oxidase assembly protein ShyY1
LPMVDAGPHFSYMLQWFAFATIALVGGVILTRRGIVAERSEG